jgi:hypothetical protein
MAAYADPGRVLALMMIPALDHGCSRAGPPPPGRVSEVVRVVMLPSPASGRCTK